MSINAENIIGSYDIHSKQYILTFTNRPPAPVIPTDCSFSISVDKFVPAVISPLPTDDSCGITLTSVYSGPARTAEITGQTSANTNTNVALVGEDNNFTGYKWEWTGGNLQGLTTKNVSATSSTAGSVTYGVTINDTYTDSHSINWTNPYSATITGPTSQTINSNITLTGEDDGFTGSTWSWTGGAAAGLTSKVITITETSTGTQTYGVTIDGTYSDTHTVTWSPPAPFIQINGATSGAVNSNITLTAEDYNFTGSTWAWTGGAAQGLTSKTITITETSTGSVTYGATVDGAYTDTHIVNWAASLPVFECSNAGFAVSDGTTGDTISINTDATVNEGTLNSVSPTAYQSGSATYTANITIPAGYQNAGGTITICSDTATGTAATPTYSCSNTTYTQANGITGNATAPGATFSDSNITTYSISPSTYTSGSATYTATITVPAGYTNSGQSLTLTACPATATGTDAYTRNMLLAEGVTDNPTYQITWSDNSQTVSLVSTGSGATKIATRTLSNTSIAVSVSRTSPDAIADAITEITWTRLNSSSVQQETNQVTINPNNAVTSQGYTFTNVANGDTLFIDIQEN